MALLEVNWRPSPKELRWFALGLAVIVGGLACLRGIQTDSTLAWGVAAVAGFCGIVGVWRPAFIHPVYLVWMAAAYPIGWTVSHTLLVGTYFLVVTPIALVMRALGRDPMQRRLERSRQSYWVPREPVRSRSRYLQQF